MSKTVSFVGDGIIKLGLIEGKDKEDNELIYRKSFTHEKNIFTKIKAG